jgi:replicative DNA helicase
MKENYGYIPPQDVEAEVAILGALLISKDSIYEIKDEIEIDYFYKEEHQIIYKNILQLLANKTTIDLITIVSNLRTNGELLKVGNAAYVTSLTNRVAGAHNIKDHALLVKVAYLRRKIIAGASEMIKMAYDGVSLSELITSTEFLNQDITNITMKNNGVRHISEVLNDSMNELVYRYENALQGIEVGLMTQLRAVDKKTYGFRGGQLITIAARPGQGKTSLAVFIAKMVSKVLNDVAFFSLEMTDTELGDRLILAESGVDSEKYLMGKIDEYEMQTICNAKDRLNKYALWIDDKPLAKIGYIESTAKMLKRQGKLKMVIIDYLQLADVSEKGSNREQEISSATRRLKALAKELDVPIIILSQLNREVEKRADKIPQLSDLRESGSIEQDSDTIIFLMRPKEYGITLDDLSKNFNGLPMGLDYYLEGLMILNFAKIRNGKTGFTFAKHNSAVNNYTDYEFNPQ